MLYFLDAALTAIHYAIILFNLFGWIVKRWRKVHFFFICLTAASWFILGIWYGVGYCPITDWYWQIKNSLGQTGLPASFIKYEADKLTGNHYSPAFINGATVVLFVAAASLSVYFNFINPKRKR